MNGLTLMPLPILQLLTCVFYLLCIGQVLHLFFLTSRRLGGHPGLSIAYEAALLLHLLVFVMLCQTSMNNTGEPTVWLWFFEAPLEPFLWVNAIAFVLGVADAWLKKRPSMVVELAVLFACTPPLIELLGLAWSVIFVLDAAFFLFRGVFCLLCGLGVLSSSASKISMVEAVKGLPEGIMYVDRRGKVILMNDTMRSCLGALGIPTDLADSRGLLDKLSSKAQELTHTDEVPGAAATNCSGSGSKGAFPRAFKLSIPDLGVRIFTFDEVVLGRKTCQQITAVDITEEESLNAHLAATNEQLYAAGMDIRTSMEKLRTVEENEVRLKMRQRVHDVIGQRLSILHHCFDDDDLSEETLSKITTLLDSILEDLGSVEEFDPVEALAAVVAAFDMVGVVINVEGVLPAKPHDARTCVSIIREASTNAVRHAQASLISVSIESGKLSTGLSICDNGESPVESFREGCGISGMRKAVSDVGGTFRVDVGPPFTVRMTLGSSKLGQV